MGETLALLIDDEMAVHGLVKEALEPTTVDRVISALTPGDGIRQAIDQLPAVILLDINMPEMDGFKVCRLLKENEVTRDAAVLFLTVEHNVVHLARGFDCGATDYIRKPVNPIELQARVRVALRDNQMVELLREQARIDALTGLMNRAALNDALEGAASAHQRTGAPSGLLMLDVDHFKDINDTRGHGAGDEVLRAIGGTIRACCRPYDTPCRFGGDEFAVIFGQVEGTPARCAAERILEVLHALEVSTGRGRLAFTVSAGLATTSEMPARFKPNALLEAADAALYAAKTGGRDRLVMAEMQQD
jgi:diguanylate cyclase (GGDEF)-like protein